MNSETGKYIMLAGAVILLMGVIVYFFHDKLHWIGRLPGDIRIEKGQTRIYFPIVTMLLFSLVLSGLLWLIRKFL